MWDKAKRIESQKKLLYILSTSSTQSHRHTRHNQSCEAVARLEKTVKDIEGKVADSVSKKATSQKHLKDTTQKVELKSELNFLYTRLKKLEKEQPLIKDNVEETGNRSLIGQN